MWGQGYMYKQVRTRPKSQDVLDLFGTVWLFSYSANRWILDFLRRSPSILWLRSSRTYGTLLSWEHWYAGTWSYWYPAKVWTITAWNIHHACTLDFRVVLYCKLDYYLGIWCEIGSYMMCICNYIIIYILYIIQVVSVRFLGNGKSSWDTHYDPQR